MRVAIIGAGITGLSAAHVLHRLLPEARVTLFEAAIRPGGLLNTLDQGDYVVERGADSFLTDPSDAVDLCRELGLERELVPVADACRRALIVREGKLLAVPEGWTLFAPARFASLWQWPGLSKAGKLRVLAERHIRPRSDGVEESFHDFAVRRLGLEAYERLVQPLVAGIYTADPHRLSMQAALPKWTEWERSYGSLTRAVRSHAKQATLDRDTATERHNESAAADRLALGSGARYAMFATPRRGLGSLIAALVERLPPGSLRLATAVESLARRGQEWWVCSRSHVGSTARLSAAEPSTTEPFDAAIVALPAPRAAELFKESDPTLSAALSAIEYASSAVVTLRVAEPQITRPQAAAGFVVPDCEKRAILAVSFSSQKFPQRAPSGQALLRVFLGGARLPALVEASDQELLQVLNRELRELLGLQGEPLQAEVVRWRNAMPQYVLGHAERVALIERLAAQHPGLALAGNAYHGVGIPLCIRSGTQAAKQLAEWQHSRHYP